MRFTFKRIPILFIPVLIIIIVISCFPDAEDLEMKEAEQIDNYIRENPDVPFILKPSGLYFYESQAGTGIMPETNDTVYVYFTCKFLSGAEVETNIGTKDTMIAALNTGQLILGLDEGLSYLKVGGKATLLIPSKLAYGTTGDFIAIPGFTPLLFDIHLVKVKQMSLKKSI